MKVRDSKPTMEDWKALMTCTNTCLDSSKNDSFDKEIHLFATNDDVEHHNKLCLRRLNCPIVASVATKVKGNSMQIDEDEMELELIIAVGARVMLTSNIWTDAGLVNGGLGIVEKIVYKPRKSPPEPPTYVLVRFDNYMGVPWDDSSPKTVPITPIERGSRK